VQVKLAAIGSFEKVLAVCGESKDSEDAGQRERSGDPSLRYVSDSKPTRLEAVFSIDHIVIYSQYW
jgi:hypothetical protein